VSGASSRGGRPSLARVTLYAAIGALQAACAVGPRYAPPQPPAPASDAFAAGTANAAVATEPPDQWWQLYEDPAIDRLVSEALTHNRNLLAAAANLAQARAALALARAGHYQTTTLSMGAQYGVSADQAFASHLKGTGAPSPSLYFTPGLDVSYELDLFGRVRRTVEAAAADYDAGQAAEDVSRVSVAGETTRSYVNACAYAQQLEVARRSLKIVTEESQLTRQEVAAGAANDLDLARANELVAQTRAMLPVYEGGRRTALFSLAVLTGRPPEEIDAAADACTSPPRLAEVLPVGDVKSLFRRRPDVRQAERQLAANTARIGVAAADLYPSIALGGSIASAATTLGGIASRSNLIYGVGPLLSWTFPNTLVARAQVREARATASAALAAFQGAILTALQDTENALTAYATELDRNDALREARDQAHIAFGLADEGFRLGHISYLDLLTTESDLVNAEATLAASDQALASDQVTVFKALGGGWRQAPAVVPLPIEDARTGAATPVR